VHGVRGDERMAWGPDSVEVGLNLGVAQLKGTWKPDDTQRRAAWELYVELVTRIAVVPLAGNEGLLREALTSLYALFAITRDVLRRHGPQVAMPTRDSEYSLGQIAVAVLNDELRPLLARWHPALEEWEARRPPDSSRVAHEDAWEHARALRAELAGTRRRLADYAALLATACGVPDLTTRR